VALLAVALLAVALLVWALLARARRSAPSWSSHRRRAAREIRRRHPDRPR